MESPGAALLPGWILHKPGLAIPARIKVSPWPVCPVPLFLELLAQHLQTGPRWGRLGDVQLLQCLGRMSAFHPTIPWCIEGGLDSLFSAN